MGVAVEIGEVVVRPTRLCCDGVVDQWVCLWLNDHAFCEREVRIFLFYFILF